MRPLCWPITWSVAFHNAPPRPVATTLENAIYNGTWHLRVGILPRGAVAGSQRRRARLSCRFTCHVFAATPDCSDDFEHVNGLVRRNGDVVLFAFAFGKHSAVLCCTFCYCDHAVRNAFLWQEDRTSPGWRSRRLAFLLEPRGPGGHGSLRRCGSGRCRIRVFYVLQIWWSEQADALLIPLGMLAGFATASNIPPALLSLMPSAGFWSEEGVLKSRFGSLAR